MIDMIDRIAERFRVDRYTVYLVILIIAFIVFLAVKSVYIGAHVDEARWWMQTKHLQASYFDEPPLVAFQQFAITKVFGDGVFALRLGSMLYNVLSLILVYVLSLELFGDKMLALFTALLVAIRPLALTTSNIGAANAPFYFFWLVGVFLVWRAVSRKQKAYWYLAGLAAGLMLLSNLRAFLFFPGVLLFLIASRENRFWLRRKEPYVAFCVAALMFLPTILWFASRHFEPIILQFNRSGFIKLGLAGYFSAVFKHILHEIVGLSPFIYLLCLFGLVYGGYLALTRKDSRFELLFWMSAPTILFFLVTAGIDPHWALPGYMVAILAGMGALSVLISETSNRRVRKYWLPVVLTLCVALPFILTMGETDFAATSDITTCGWNDIARKAGEVGGSMSGDQKPYFASPYYPISAEVAYHERNSFSFAGFTLAFSVYEYEYYFDNSNYSPWVPLDRLKGKDFVFVDEKKSPDDFDTPVSYWKAKLKPYFNTVEEPVIFTEKLVGKETRTFYIFKCYGFNGPDSKMDSKGEVRKYVRKLGESSKSDKS